MPRRGLPETAKMRHDAHYVDGLAAAAGAPIGRMISIELIDPNPHQPRSAMGDLAELMASITEKGILEPLIVRQLRDRFQIVAGERRYQAAVRVGVSEVPVIVRDIDDGESIELALIENIQRKDLTAFEEAEALKSLAERFHYTHEELARRLGKSRTSITESLSLNAIPDDVKDLCRLAELDSKSTLLQVARQPDAQAMVALVERITASGMTRADVRKAAAKPAGGRQKPFAYKWVAPSKTFSLRLNFRKASVSRDELIEALEQAVAELRTGSDAQ
ncbi:MAG: ParB/RepB/Spo0J family partition protein [Acidobacteria bacterium]|nr:ParB/RepB/Spo0J family partition protein [Acidobacteriota bacterium]